MSDARVHVDRRTSGRESQTEVDETRSRVTCPECDGRLVPDSEHGETICRDCGLVSEEDVVDRGPEWRAFDAADQRERTRVGAPMTNLLHDKGLSSTIGWQNKDAAGRTVSARRRTQLQRLRTWDERFRTKDSQERNLKQAFGEIERMSAALGISDPCRETAGVLYRRAVETGLLPGRSIEAMTTASLYAAARTHGQPRTFAEFASVSRVEQLPIERAYRYLSRELGLRIAPADPEQYLPQFGSSLGVTDETEQHARELLKVAKDAEIHSGKSPSGLAGAALYAASHLTNDGLTQGTVSDVTNVSRVTIRKRYQELLEVYEANAGSLP